MAPPKKPIAINPGDLVDRTEAEFRFLRKGAIAGGIAFSVFTGFVVILASDPEYYSNFQQFSSSLGSIGMSALALKNTVKFLNSQVFRH